MITLNLIPESIREENRLKHVFELNLRLGLVIFYVMVIVGVLTQVSKYILVSSFVAVKNQSELITKNSKAYNDRAREINEKINLVDQVVHDSYDWNGLIMDVSFLMPDGVVLSQLSFNQETKGVRLVGVAETREDLLKLKEVIDASGYIKEIKLPMASIIEKKDIGFNIESKIDYDAHKKMSKK